MDHYDKSACLWGLGLVDSFFFLLISQIFYRVELTLQAKEMLLETNIYKETLPVKTVNSTPTFLVRKESYRSSLRSFAFIIHSAT